MERQMREDVSPSEFARMLADAPLARPAPPDERLRTALAWLAVTPAWPEEIAAKGFPVDKDSMGTGPLVSDVLREMETRGLVRSGPGVAPLEESDWFHMDQQQRAAAFDGILKSSSQGTAFLRSTWSAAANQFQEAAGQEPINPQFQRWIDLAKADDAAALLEDKVKQAVEQAQKSGALGCPDALRWIEAAQPLAELFGGLLEDATARSLRKLEQFRRDARDKRHLLNYYPREGLENEFRALAGPATKDSWALHYVGMGGIGKSMLVRQIRCKLAKEHGMTAAHVDFDHLNPNYPRRAPGLLLAAFAEDLRLNEDPSVVSLFQTFDDAIKTVHGALEGVYRTEGRIVDAADALNRIEGARKLFVSALKQIATRSKPLLILDTCEELARIRSDGTLPDNVQVTFDLLEAIRKEVEELRVVFSGRRPLSKKGLNWEWPGCDLPKREYLRLAGVTPFDEGEANGLLKEYKRDDRGVPEDLWPGILELSDVHRKGRRRAPRIAASPVVWTDGTVSKEPAGKLYYPYELDLYASWASDPKGLDLAILKSRGATYYCEERIVNRVSYLVAEWLPHLALLGRFDRLMLEQLTGISQGAFDTRWEYLVAQEWTELDRSAGRSEVWSMVPASRDLLLEYFHEKHTPELEAAAAQVKNLLEAITNERPFGELSTAYFEAAVEVLQADQERLARWWRAVDDKIAREDWNWGKLLTDVLLDDESVAGVARPELNRTPGQECVLRAAILATRAAASVQLGETVEEKTWREVCEKSARHPLAEERPQLLHRGRCGVVVAKVLAGQVADAVAELKQFPNQIPWNDQTVASDIAMWEQLVEAVENLAAPEAASFSRELLPHCPQPQNVRPELAAFQLALHGRMEEMAAPGSGARLLREAVAKAPEQASREWLDWRAPRELKVRLELELARLEPPTHQVRAGQTIDSDRLASAFLVWESRVRVPETAVLMPELEERQPVYKATCNAHRAFPPYYAVAIEVLAAHGGIDEAIADAQKISSHPKLPLHMRQAADRALVTIAIPLLLGEERIGLQTTLAESTRDEDKAANTAVRLLRLGPANPSTPEHDALLKWLGSPVPASQPRRAARQLVWQALDDVATARPRFRAALEKFESAGDEQGKLLCRVGLAVCEVASQGDPAIALAAVNTALGCSALPDVNGRSPGSASPAEEWTKWLEAIPPAWRPWMIRLAACAIRVQEFGRAGEQTEKLKHWLANRYSTGIPAGIANLLANPEEPKVEPPPAPVQMPPVPVREPVRKGIAYFLLGLIIIALVCYGVYKFEVWALDLVGIHWGFWPNIGLLALVIALGSAVPAMFRVYFRTAREDDDRDADDRDAIESDAAPPEVQPSNGKAIPVDGSWTVLRQELVRLSRQLLGRMTRIAELEFRVQRQDDEQIMQWNDPLVKPWRIVQTGYIRISVRLFRLRLRGDPFRRLTETTSFDAPYRQQSQILETRSSKWFHSWIPASESIDTAIFVGEESSAAPWEAVIGLMQGRLESYGQQRYGFRRERPDQTIRLDTPLRADLKVVTWSAERSAKRYAPAAWEEGLQGTWNHALAAPEFSGGTLRRDAGIGVAHIVGKPVETEGGLRIRMSNSSAALEEPIQPDQIAAALRSARLCIVQDFPETPRQRLTSDRYAANLARRLCFQMVRAGVPAVIYIPPLQEPETAWVLTRLAQAIGGSAQPGLASLKSAVQEVRRRIAGMTHPDSEAPTEIAFDVCFYSPASLNLKREPTSNANVL
jgi:hypothetical protein